MELFQRYIRVVQKTVQDVTGFEQTDLLDVEKFCSCAIRVFSAELDVNNVVQGQLLNRSKGKLEMSLLSKKQFLLICF